jgi:futalosine hydrolase
MQGALRILIVTATGAEAEAASGFSSAVTPNGTLVSGNCVTESLVTGVGSVSTAWSLLKWLSSNPKPDLAINAGIAGSFRDGIEPGDVVMPVSDCFADAGIETREGFFTLWEAGLQGLNDFPFRNGLLVPENSLVNDLKMKIRPVKAITVNTATGTAATIEKLTGKYDPDIETMEGAAFFYICLRENIPCAAIRSVSNRVEPRDRSKWQIGPALRNLSGTMQELLLKMQ